MQPAPLPNSLWAATADPAPETPPLEGEHRVDVAVVGGGFTGLSAALHLAEAGTDVALVEQAEPGWGASGRNGGQVIPGFKLDPGELVARFGPERGERLAAFAGGVTDFVFDLIDKHRIACHPQRSGWIQSVHGAAALRTAERRVRQWAQRGAPVELLDADAIAELTGGRGYVGGWVDRRGGALQPLGYARGLARAAQNAGARVHGASPATEIARANGGWRVATPGGALRAEQVLLCTNAYTDALWPGLARSMIPVLSYQVATRPLGDNLRRTILPQGHVSSDTRRLLQYYRLDHTGRLVMGGSGRLRDTDEPRFYADVMGALEALYPQLGAPELEFYWCGKVALTLDHMPHLHELAPGVTAALGYNGRGVAMASAVGKLLAQRARGKALEDLPLPVVPLRPIPFHGLRRPALAAAVLWKKLLDRMEVRR